MSLASYTCRPRPPRDGWWRDTSRRDWRPRRRPGRPPAARRAGWGCAGAWRRASPTPRARCRPGAPRPPGAGTAPGPRPPAPAPRPGGRRPGSRRRRPGPAHGAPGRPCAAASTPATSARIASAATPTRAPRSRRLTVRSRRTRASAARSSDADQGGRRLEEGLLGVAQVRVRSIAPLQRAAEPGAAVELALGAAHRVPRVRGTGQVPEDPLPVDVVVEPAAQPRPHPHQRLVGDLDRVPVDAHQAGVDELLDQVSMLVVGSDLRAGHAGAHRVAVLGGHDQAQQESAEAIALGLVHRVVQALGGLGHGGPDPAGRPVAVDGQRRSLPALPGRPQHVRQHAAGRPARPRPRATSRSTRPGSSRSPARRAGPSMALRRSGSLIGPSR